MKSKITTYEQLQYFLVNRYSEIMRHDEFPFEMHDGSNLIRWKPRNEPEMTDVVNLVNKQLKISPGELLEAWWKSPNQNFIRFSSVLWDSKNGSFLDNEFYRINVPNSVEKDITTWFEKKGWDIEMGRNGMEVAQYIVNSLESCKKVWDDCMKIKEILEYKNPAVIKKMIQEDTTGSTNVKKFKDFGFFDGGA